MGSVPVIGTGLAEWDHIHVHDLSDLLVSLTEASRDIKLAADPEVFGEHGYHFCEAGTHRWGDVAKCEFRGLSNFSRFSFALKRSMRRHVHADGANV